MWGRIFGKNDLNGYKADRIEYEKDISQFDLSKLDTPKYGKVDPNNTPHVGGMIELIFFLIFLKLKIYI